MVALEIESLAAGNGRQSCHDGHEASMELVPLLVQVRRAPIEEKGHLRLIDQGEIEKHLPPRVRRILHHLQFRTPAGNTLLLLSTNPREAPARQQRKPWPRRGTEVQGTVLYGQGGMEAMQEIETEQLRLRRFTSDDLDTAHHVHGDAEVTHHV